MAHFNSFPTYTFTPQAPPQYSNPPTPHILHAYNQPSPYLGTHTRCTSPSFSIASHNDALYNETLYPSEHEFEDIVAEYLSNLSPKKRDKALVDTRRYELILAVLEDPKNTSISTAQFRFWVKKMFHLDEDVDGRGSVWHDGKPVARREDIHQILIRAHREAQHGGRDKTSALVRKRYSWIPKELVARFVRHCPFCISRRTSSSPCLPDGIPRTPNPTQSLMVSNGQFLQVNKGGPIRSPFEEEDNDDEDSDYVEEEMAGAGLHIEWQDWNNGLGGDDRGGKEENNIAAQDIFPSYETTTPVPMHIPDFSAESTLTISDASNVYSFPHQRTPSLHQQQVPMNIPKSATCPDYSNNGNKLWSPSLLEPLSDSPNLSEAFPTNSYIPDWLVLQGIEPTGHVPSDSLLRADNGDPLSTSPNIFGITAPLEYDVEGNAPPLSTPYTEYAQLAQGYDTNAFYQSSNLAMMQEPQKPLRPLSSSHSEPIALIEHYTLSPSWHNSFLPQPTNEHPSALVRNPSGIDFVTGWPTFDMSSSFTDGLEDDNKAAWMRVVPDVVIRDAF